MGKKEEDNVSMTGTGADTAKGSAMMDLISGLQQQKDSDDTEGGSTGTGKSRSKGGRGKKKKGKKTVIKRKRRKDRYESQNFLLRIEGTLCCASIIIAVIWLLSLFVVMLICGIWSDFDFTATTDSVKTRTS